MTYDECRAQQAVGKILKRVGELALEAFQSRQSMRELLRDESEAVEDTLELPSLSGLFDKVAKAKRPAIDELVHGYLHSLQQIAVAVEDIAQGAATALDVSVEELIEHSDMFVAMMGKRMAAATN